MNSQKRVTFQIEDGNIVEIFIDSAVLRGIRKMAQADGDALQETAAIGDLVNRALVHYLFERMFETGAKSSNT